MSKKLSFVIYHDWKDIFEALDDSQIRELLFAMFELSMDGAVRSFDNKMLKGFWNIISKQMSRDSLKYDSTCEIRSINKQIDYLKKDGVSDNSISIKELEEQKRFLKDNGYAEYLEKYKCVQVYTSVTDVTGVTLVTDNKYVNDIDNVKGTDNAKETDDIKGEDTNNKVKYVTEKVKEKDTRENHKETLVNEPMSLAEIKDYYSGKGYNFNLNKCLQAKKSIINRDEIKELFEFWQSTDGKNEQ